MRRIIFRAISFIKNFLFNKVFSNLNAFIQEIIIIN